jgi:RNA polymerase sigma-70 factor (ECF subfamily)
MTSYQKYSDTELTALLNTGDKIAFETIYRRYASGLYRYARKNIGVKEDCEEIIQEVFESLWTRRESLGHVTVLSAYLFRMVKYKVIRYFQHHAVRKKYAGHFKLFEAVYGSTQEEESDPSSIQAGIEKVIAQLPERCQFALKLRLTENLSNHDIARRMNIKKSTVENYMVTALAHLRATYQDLAS